MQPLRYNIAHIQFGYSFFITFYQKCQYNSCIFSFNVWHYSEKMSILCYCSPVISRKMFFVSESHRNPKTYHANLCDYTSVRVLKKQVLFPVWQAAPICSTLARIVSLSQSSVRDFTNWRCPDVSPFVQSSLRLLLQ